MKQLVHARDGSDDRGGPDSLDERARALVSAGDVRKAATLVLRQLGPEVFGFLCGALASETDADEVFAAASERVWRSIGAFRWQCSLRTWIYVIARREMLRFAEAARRQRARRANPSELDGIVAAVRTETRSFLKSEKLNRLRALRDELPVDDRTLLILRVDRSLPWEDIALAFLPDGDPAPDEAVKREAARLRKRFQLVKQRLADRARQERLI